MKAYLFSLTLFLSVLPFGKPNFNIWKLNSGKYIKNHSTEDNYWIKKIVIDPGHGGRDSGCSGHSHREKDIALNISLKLGRSIKAHFPEIQVIYTRNSDVFVPLNERAGIANRNNADLFISIHCNAMDNADQVYGSETYVMGLHKAEANLAVAKRENASILLEANYDQVYAGYDPNSPEGHIILSMYQNAYLEQSILFAEKVEKNIKHQARRKSRGVKQAGFVVLRETTMPSVLIEAGYLTNASDADFLAHERGQNKIANSILKAFQEYKREIEKSTTNRILANAPIERAASPRSYQIKGSRKPAKVKALQADPHFRPSKTPSASPIQYKVLLASTSQLADTSKGPWKNIDYSVQMIQENNAFKYYVIGFQSYEDAAVAKKQLRSAGFNEAFVVGYQNGQRIDLTKHRSRK